MLSQLKSHKKIALLAGVVLVMAIGIILRLRYTARFEPVSPKRGSITEAIYGIGTVKSNEVYEQKLGVLGSVDKLYVKEGDVVKKGSLLLRTEEYVTFRAPFTGTVTQLFFNEKELVMPGSTILKMVNINDNYVQVSLDQESALRVKAGQNAQLSFESIRGKSITGKVKKIYPSKGSFLITIDVENMPAEILPDMTADVAIEVAKRENVLMIPLSGINRGIARVKRKGKTKKLKVSIGAINNQWAEVLDGSILEDDIIMVKKE